MKIRAALTIALFSLLAACGGNDKSAPIGAAIAPNFRDADPVDFKQPAPSRFAVHGALLHKSGGGRATPSPRWI